MQHESFLLGLAGFPLEHSFSPRMHNAALNSLGLSGEYRLFPIPPCPNPTDQIARLLDQVRRGEVHGLNVTIPYKQSIMMQVDEYTPEAQAIGAINTVFRKGNKLIGTNTDAAGFLADLSRFFPVEKWSLNPHNLSALVLGAGGSARAVVYALASSGWQVTVAARRIEQAEALCLDLQSYQENLPPIKSTNLGTTLVLPEPLPILIVNTTPVGMHPHEAASPWPANLPFPSGAMIYDLIYNPADTTLMKSARIAGLATTNGLGMLLEQAVLAFEQWFDRPAPRSVMHQALLDSYTDF